MTEQSRFIDDGTNEEQELKRGQDSSRASLLYIIHNPSADPGVRVALLIIVAQSPPLGKTRNCGVRATDHDVVTTVKKVRGVPVEYQ